MSATNSLHGATVEFPLQIAAADPVLHALAMDCLRHSPDFRCTNTHLKYLPATSNFGKTPELRLVEQGFLALPWWLFDADISGKKSQQAKPLAKENLFIMPSAEPDPQSLLGTEPQVNVLQSLRESLTALQTLLSEVKNKAYSTVLLSATEDLLPEGLQALSQAETLLGNQHFEVCFLPSALFRLDMPCSEDILLVGSPANRFGRSELACQKAASSWVALQTRRSHFVQELFKNKAKAFASQEGQSLIAAALKFLSEYVLNPSDSYSSPRAFFTGAGPASNFLDEAFRRRLGLVIRHLDNVLKGRRKELLNSIGSQLHQDLTRLEYMTSYYNRTCQISASQLENLMRNVRNITCQNPFLALLITGICSVRVAGKGEGAQDSAPVLCLSASLLNSEWTNRILGAFPYAGFLQKQRDDTQNGELPEEGSATHDDDIRGPEQGPGDVLAPEQMAWALWQGCAF